MAAGRRAGSWWSAGIAVALLVVAAPPVAGAARFRAEVRFAQAGAQRIAFYERGSGPPLLMAIGTGSTMAEWDPALLARLARGRRLILFDYPGIGRSSGLSGGRTSFAALADTTARFLTAIGVQRADVLGWSMGGFVAQQLAIRHPTRVRALILAATNPGSRATTLGSPVDQRIDSDPTPSDAAALRVLYPRTAAGRAAGRSFLRRLEHAAATGEIPDDFRVPRATVRAQVAAEDPWLRGDANLRALRALPIPTLAAGGDRDPVVPAANLRLIARTVPGARLALYRGGAHAFLFQFHDRFATRALAFLDAAMSFSPHTGLQLQHPVPREPVPSVRQEPPRWSSSSTASGSSASTAVRSSRSTRRSRSRSAARTRKRSTTTGSGCPRAARKDSAAGSRTGSASPGRSSRPAWRSCSPIRTPSAPSAR
jgi:pimeloyl-ACP methyl ester carboxylesterase